MRRVRSGTRGLGTSRGPITCHFDPERLLYESDKQGPCVNGPQILTATIGQVREASARDKELARALHTVERVEPP